jgi:UDP-galactopyranose mutase
MPSLATDRKEEFMNYDYLIVGAGFSGSVCAEQLAAAGKKVLLIDKRTHIGGNAYDQLDEHGVLIHPYGPHIFHTNSKKVFAYLSQFTDWKFYEHRVLANLHGELLPIPINRTTLNKLYKLDLTEEQAKDYFEKVRVHGLTNKTSEDVVLGSIGHDLCDKFFRGYSQKQWGLDLSELSAGVAARIPTRTNDDDRYFTDTYQFMPAQGYTRMFECLLNNPNITLQLDADFESVKKQVQFKHLIYTGPIDSYFEHCHGKLPYRSLRFEHTHLAGVDKYQAVGTVNFPVDQDYTRITEFKHLTMQQHDSTSIVKEYPTSEGDPYYPIPRPENEALFKKYQEMADNTSHVTFVGRLAQYRYYNMDQVVAAALETSKQLLNQSE